MTPRITIIGSANIDYVMQVPQLPTRGETITGATFFQTFGGKGANQAVAAARAGGKVAFVGALGNDLYAETYLAHLKGEGLNTDHLSLEPDIPGGSALIMVDERGDNYISVAPGSNSRVTPERVQAVESVIASSDWIVLQQEIPMESNRAVLEVSSRLDRPVLLNYAPAQDLRLQPTAAVHGLVVNEIEAAALAGNEFDPENCASARALAMGLRETGNHRFVVLTLGRSGVVFADASGSHGADAFAVDAVDTTAAGDTFCGALAVGLGEGRALAEAVRFASAAAALSVTKVGAQSSIPTRHEIDTFLAS